MSLANNSDAIPALAQGGADRPLLEMSANGSANNMASTDPIEQLKSITSEQTNDAADLLASWLEQDSRAVG